VRVLAARASADVHRRRRGDDARGHEAHARRLRRGVGPWQMFPATSSTRTLNPRILLWQELNAVL
jgi:hypothetical protein